MDLRLIEEARPADRPPAARFREYTVSPGTTLSLKLTTAINSGANRPEDPVQATLAGPCRSEAPRYHPLAVP